MSNKPKVKTIKKLFSEEELEPFIGHGAPYVVNQKHSSSLNAIESDHIPPINIWSYIDKNTAEKLPKKLQDIYSDLQTWRGKARLHEDRSHMVSDKIKFAMATISVPYKVHRKFPTTVQNGYDDDIRQLDKGNSEDAKNMFSEKVNHWKELLDNLIGNG